MKTNKIRELRHKLGLTQKQLAELVKTSQQQIQRIEVGQYVKLDLAIKICAALQSPLEQIFPSTKTAITKLRKRNPAQNTQPDPEMDKAMEAAGIDVDPAHWSVRFRLKNGLEGVWNLSSNDKDRLVHCSQETHKMFFCGTSRNTEIAVNLRHLSFFQPCFDFGVIEEQGEESNEVRVYLADSAKPLAFQVEPDEAIGEEEEDEGEFRNLLYSLDMFDEGSEGDPVISFIDEDGERVFLRTEQIVLVEIPLWVTHPDLEDDADLERLKA